jgi:hypothetical protein
MIISPGRNYIFVHIPKTGGTSMALALEDRAMADDILIGDTPKAVRRRKRLKTLDAPGRLWKHARLADIDGMAGMPPDPFVFTLVRNPWDRMVSLYHWAKAQNFDHPMVSVARAHDFAGFLSHPGLQPAFAQDGAAAYVTRRDGTLACDAFIRLEHLATDLVPLETHLGVKLVLPHVNAKPHPVTARHYTPALVDLVARHYADDVRRFGYRPPGPLASHPPKD